MATPYSVIGLSVSERARRTATKLGQMKRWHPAADHTELEQDTLAARLDVVLVRLRDEYPGVILRPEQLDHVADVLTGRALA
ncbi:hypothetical protein [Corynebacterium glyciniphilum]|uniref:hypothetical protein n=1 Tax=Corynebacterium glyciniphilum TaxID=1404244 RepID=UPI003FD14F07